MATRSIIGYSEDDKIWKAVYCHTASYLEYMGCMLAKHYSEPETAEALINCGMFGGIKMIPDPSEILTKEWYYIHEPEEAFYEIRSEKDIKKIAADTTAEYIYLYSKPKKEWNAIMHGENWNNSTFFDSLSYESLKEAMKEVTLTDEMAKLATQDLEEIFAQHSIETDTLEALEEILPEIQFKAVEFDEEIASM